MKQSVIILSVIILAASCNRAPKAAETTVITIPDTAVVTEVKTPPVQKQKRITSLTASGNSTINTSETMTSESSNGAKAKKGWSKTAKGAVIGTVVGAGTGAVVNKKNRVKGAIIGGVVGAGSGAIIGHELDKQSGRH